MVDLQAAGQRAIARCDALGVAPYSDSQTGLYRAWLTPAHRAAQDKVAQWMGQAGMATRIDAASNLVGRYQGNMPHAPALLIGSHLDSVRDAGRYDGPLGIMLGIECVAALQASGARLPFAIEVIAFGDEEGSRFPASMFTSRAVAGTLSADALDGIVDAAGVSVAEALRGWQLDPARITEAARRPEQVIGYLEAHIEQGPVLEAEGLALGVVTGIAAQLRFEVTVTGRAGHAGTSPMPLRADALAAAAECVLAVEAIARADDSDLVATVGRLQVLPGATNVVPGQVPFSLDVRAGDDATRDAGAAQILGRFQAIAAARGVQVQAIQVQDLAASPCDVHFIALLEQAVAAQDIAPYRLVSGAGHDAMVMRALCPTAMLFVRCDGGISHNPAERAHAADAGVAVAAMLDFIERLGATRGT
ncbi:allantoate amidohydrolase [Pseudoxanthomonas spadix]|nr:allantoate amidohydrolase [Pseudoxanthomonas spadix]MBP3975125.1 allantoate amidohydrolase [Pseudoxanthomonas spadix]RMW98167.1 allantoate amidohydrolase [Pseudoxanthomonas spadix]